MTVTDWYTLSCMPSPRQSLSRAFPQSPTKTSKKYQTSSKKYQTPSKNYQTPSKKYQQKQTPSKPKRFSNWSPSVYVSGGRGSSPKEYKSFSSRSHYFSTSNKEDITKNWDFQHLRLELSFEEFSLNVSRMLEEMNTFLIHLIVLALGKSKAIQLMKTTKAVQQLGGLELPRSPRQKKSNKPRRKKRTVGGVFIQLSKEALSTEKWKKINRLSEKNKPKKKKSPRNRKTPRVLFGHPSLDGLNAKENENKNPRNNLNEMFDKQLILEEDSVIKTPEKNKNNANLLKEKRLCRTPEKSPQSNLNKLFDKQMTLEKDSIIETPEKNKNNLNILKEKRLCRTPENSQSNLNKIFDKQLILEEGPIIKTSEKNKSTSILKDKQSIGEHLYPKIRAMAPTHAGKVTGMLLDGMDCAELQDMLNHPHLLEEAVNDAMNVYKEAFSAEEKKLPEEEKLIRESKRSLQLGERLYNEVKESLDQNQGESLVGKITGMLLEMPTHLLIPVIESPHALGLWIKYSMSLITHEKRNLGNLLYPRVKLYIKDDEKAQKVTGMLLEMDPVQLSALNEDALLLKEKVDDCLDVLKPNGLVLNFVAPCRRKKSTCAKFFR